MAGHAGSGRALLIPAPKWSCAIKAARLPWDWGMVKNQQGSGQGGAGDVAHPPRVPANAFSSPSCRRWNRAGIITAMSLSL